jgi:hypothetical protein
MSITAIFLGAMFASSHLLLYLCLLLLYFIPSIVAFSNKKSNTTAILILNFFLGWSFIGWIIALVWAVSKDNKPQNIVITNNTNATKKYKNGINHLDQLEKLKKLLDDGVITFEEFEKQKGKIFN